MSLRLIVPINHPDTAMVVHFLREFSAWWRLNLIIESNPNPSELSWQLVSNSANGTVISMPACSADRLPEHCSTQMLLVGNTLLELPCPATESDSASDYTYSFDLFNFLAGQLWRAEEQLPSFLHQTTHALSSGFLGDRFHFFDRPIVDLWMRGLFEKCLGGILLEPHPSYWLTFDVDCLQKWKGRSRLKHFARLPQALLRGQFALWSLQLQESQRSRRLQDDPWYQVPHILQRVGERRSTFFWLGTPRDYQAYRYDIRRTEFACLLESTVQHGHSAGLHGSPRHYKSQYLLNKELQRIQNLTLSPIQQSRQHYLRIDPKSTLHALDQLGFRVDSSLGFNNRPGFRCGSCTPIRWWDFHRNQALHLTELPFSIGDFTVHNPAKFHVDQSRSMIRAQAGWTLLAGGMLTLLFHELYFWEGDFPGHAQFFSSVLSDLEEMGLQSAQP